jgi:hypothetical protein
MRIETDYPGLVALFYLFDKTHNHHSFTNARKKYYSKVINCSNQDPKLVLSYGPKFGYQSSLHISHRCTKVYMQYVSGRSYQRWNRFDSGKFGFPDAILRLAQMNDLYIVLSNQTDDVVFSGYTYRTSSMVKD